MSVVLPLEQNAVSGSPCARREILWESRGIAPLILNYANRCGQVYASSSLPSKRAPPLRYPLNRRVGRPLRRSGQFEEEKNVLPLTRIEPRFLGRQASKHYVVLARKLKKKTPLPKMRDGL